MDQEKAKESVTEIVYSYGPYCRREAERICEIIQSSASQLCSDLELKVGRFISEDESHITEMEVYVLFSWIHAMCVPESTIVMMNKWNFLQDSESTTRLPTPPIDTTVRFLFDIRAMQYYAAYIRARSEAVPAPLMSAILHTAIPSGILFNPMAAMIVRDHCVSFLRSVAETDPYRFSLNGINDSMSLEEILETCFKDRGCARWD